MWCGYPMRNKKGMTLVEVLVAMLITGIVLSAIYFVFIKVTVMNKEQQEYVKAQEGMRNTMLVIEKDIRRSSQSIELTSNAATGCYTIKDNEDATVKFEYCINDNSVTRNGHVLIDGVSYLKIDSGTGYYIEVSLKGKFGGRELKHEKKIYLRTTA